MISPLVSRVSAIASSRSRTRECKADPLTDTRFSLSPLSLALALASLRSRNSTNGRKSTEREGERDEKQHFAPSLSLLLCSAAILAQSCRLFPRLLPRVAPFGPLFPSLFPAYRFLLLSHRHQCALPSAVKRSSESSSQERKRSCHGYW